MIALSVAGLQFALPIGILTAAIGAPFFLFILLRNRAVVDL